MGEGVDGANAQRFEMVLVSAAQLPGVNIDREQYLAGALAKHFSPEVIKAAIETSPAAAGITPDQISRIADASIRYEATKVTAISAAAGIPGGFAMLGSVPADLAQYFGHVIRITQKLAYLYSWDHIFAGSEEEVDDETKNMLILFIGIMFGANGAKEAIAKVADQVAAVAVRKLPQRALTKGIIYPVAKKVAGYLGYKMTKDIFAKGVSKAIPVVGAVISGGVTLASYAPMCFKLKNYLAELEVANPQTYIAEVIEIEEFEA